VELGRWDVRIAKRSFVRVAESREAVTAPAESIAKSCHEKPYLVNPSLISFANPVVTARPRPHQRASFSE